MKANLERKYITPAGGNVFADLGFAPAEAVELQALSKKIIKEKLAIKLRALVRELNARRRASGGA